MKTSSMIVLFLAVITGCGGGGTPDPTPTCGASNCAGCCFNNACQTGTASAACGKAGAACRACASAQVCKADQTCGVEPSSVWQVQPVSAVIASNNNGSAWDGDGSAPDVAVAMRCPGSSSSFSTAQVESYTPTWTAGSCTATASQLLADPWVFQLFDIDLVSNDTITGPLGYRFLETDLLAGSVTLGPSGGMTSLTVRVTKQP